MNSIIVIQESFHIKDDFKQRVSVLAMEKTLSAAYEIYKKENPGIIICRRSFESLRPKNVRLEQLLKDLFVAALDTPISNIYKSRYLLCLH